MTEQRRFFNSKGAPTLQKSYCVFMDILGFNEIGYDSRNLRKGNALLRRLHKVISAQAKELLPESESIYSPWDAKLFTDNAVLGHVITSQDGESEFGSTILLVMLYQLSLTLEGFFARGGFSLGYLFMDENVVFGPAIVQAYEIERTTARDPRIVLSNDVFRLIVSHLRYYGEPYDSPQNSHILIDTDGRPFINYLALLFEGYYEDKFWEFLHKHKQLIEENLIKYDGNPRIWVKYQWLAGYHNFFCRECRDVSGYSKHYRVSPKLANMRPRRIITARVK